MPKFVTNRELLLEIHRSKITYSTYLSPHYSTYHAIVTYSDITSENAREIAERLNRPRQKPEVTPSALPAWPHDVVFRVMTYEHVPLCTDKKTRSRAVAGQGHERVNFPPYKHYRISPQNAVQEVGRSHWKGDLASGEFSSQHGRMSNRLAQMFMLMVERYAHRGNWRYYSYNDEMRSSALVQLAQVGLQFDESKSDNPFGFFTTTMQNSFTRTLNGERKCQSLRDDMLISAGEKPSHARQIDYELQSRFAEEGAAPPLAPASLKPRRGRPPKVSA